MIFQQFFIQYYTAEALTKPIKKINLNNSNSSIEIFHQKKERKK